jgi:cytochrome c oxidase subunit 2
MRDFSSKSQLTCQVCRNWLGVWMLASNIHENDLKLVIFMIGKFLGALLVATFFLTSPVQAQAAASATQTAASMLETAAKTAPALSAKQADAIVADVARFDVDKLDGYAKNWQLYYQDSASPVMEQLTSLHNFLLWIISIITLVVMGLMIYILLKYSEKANPKPQKFAHNATVEIIWTVIPILILVAIAIPALRTHYQYTNNETIINNPDLTIKVTGNQWYWTYEYPDHQIGFDSYMKKDDALLPGEPRLLATDNAIVVPVNKVVRLQLTASDVIHSFAVPAFGVKQDTIPGRLNETWFKATRTGIFYGQCSELCGKYHGFMPIEIHVVSQADFERWVQAAKVKFAGLAPALSDQSLMLALAQ